MHVVRPPRAVGVADRAVARLAGEQYGVVSHAQLVALGLSPDAIEWRLRCGRLHRLHRGVYLVGHAVAVDRARELSAQLACEPDAIVSHRSAARIWGLLSASDLNTPVDITVVARESHPQPGIKVHRRAWLRPRDAVLQGRLWLTTPARTLLDLAGEMRGDQLEYAIAQALRRGLASDVELAEQIRANRGRRGVSQLRRMLDRAGGPALTRSVAERRLLSLVRSESLPAPEANVVVAGFEVDFFWPMQRVIVEVDGRAFHSDPSAFERDRLRDAELCASGHAVLRTTWRQIVDDPAGVAKRIRRTLTSRRAGP